MPNVVQSIYLDSQPGALTELDAAGTGLENPYVYDSAAKDLKAMAEQGLVRIASEHVQRTSNGALIASISFERLR